MERWAFYTERLRCDGHFVAGNGGAARQSTNDGVSGVAMWNAAYSTRRG